MRTVILGAGISGLSTAYALEKLAPGSYALYERQGEVGGLCRTMATDGFQFDTVSHVLHFRSAETEALVRNLLDGRLTRRERSAWIYFRGRYVPYPFQTHLGALPLSAQLSCLAGLVKASAGRKFSSKAPPENFSEWVGQYFGIGISRHFMRPYNQKLWGIAPEQMSLDWIRPFVPRTDFKQVISNLITRRDHDSAGYNATFLYPEAGGIQALCHAFQSRLSEIYFEHEATEIDLDRRVVHFRNGHRAEYDRLITTLPLPEFIQLVRNAPEDLQREAAGLHWTRLLNLTFCLRRPVPKSYHWVYFPEPQFPFFRLVFPSNIGEGLTPKGGGLIAAEISNPPAGREDELEELVQACLIRLGWISSNADVVTVARNRFDYAYPVHDLDRARRVSRLQAFLTSRQVWSLGRFGAWFYSSIDDAITEGLQLAPQVMATMESTNAL